MQRQLILTDDDSHSFHVPELGVSYHSRYGAIQESLHVFIDSGLNHLTNQTGLREINIFEMGFGTGLNALLTLAEAEKKEVRIHYKTAELYPLHEEEVKTLNYCDQLGRTDLLLLFEKLHSCIWENENFISENFTLTKYKTHLVNFSTNQLFNLIYFDAFAPNAQPELWTKEILIKMYELLLPGGILVTYCSKGEVRRNMIAAGFKVEKLPGPPGKREMLRAVRVK